MAERLFDHHPLAARAWLLLRAPGKCALCRTLEQLFASASSNDPPAYIVHQCSRWTTQTIDERGLVLWVHFSFFWNFSNFANSEGGSSSESFGFLRVSEPSWAYCPARRLSCKQNSAWISKASSSGNRLSSRRNNICNSNYSSSEPKISTSLGVGTILPSQP